MSMQGENRSYYQYQAIYRVSKDDDSWEEKSHKYDTDILYNQFHFWNRRRLIGECQKELYDSVRCDGEFAKCEILEEKFIIIYRYVYTSNK